ncbi:UDP-N-acetylmuramoyl-tripeptide--D-alanyl-D-alanine ligase [Flavobacterium crassostreae]|uniref:UDP-N-acetylmuramoyl-tripeptide--D-alanyl-D-alanine ligase n=1 Tax=Flavobacterium crassostreae TaxID=1763534 RepID=A0A1B9DXE4_9FLAO|nr:UDP-N-acetylmuramoyl-tripeptide--D-alanyl-D-alanine ligase [Flavobacterium crassostreae]OCB74361.1 UDP-N-acetylmuramoyl-tripeptide--D-alanyl-D-alanine ligase [Flavobacterium crassostreae]
MDTNHIHELFLKCKSVSIDTRKIEVNSLFIAIKGIHFDANTFAEEALNKGAKYVLIDNKDYYIDARTILVKDSLIALQELAKYHRDYLKLPIIALTGSNGKTTTKELLYTVLSKKFRTVATLGNLNNHIGVPLTLLSFNSETEIGIVEMGANHKKEIAFLCELATPDYGYITNFGKAHLEGFGGEAGVIEGKSEMYSYLAKNKKMVFLNLDDPIQVEKTKSIQSYCFGTNNTTADINLLEIHAAPFVTIKYSNHTIKTQLIGLYNAYNIAAAISIGTYFKITATSIQEALETYTPNNNRSQLIPKGSNQIILDAYNANPSSMVVAVANFLQLDTTNKFLILGDMFELGTQSKEEHQALVDSLLGNTEVTCFFIGEAFYDCKTNVPHFVFYKSFEDFKSYLKKGKITNANLLIKGSRGMALERTLEYLN